MFKAIWSLKGTKLILRFNPFEHHKGIFLYFPFDHSWVLWYLPEHFIVSDYKHDIPSFQPLACPLGNKPCTSGIGNITPLPLCYLMGHMCFEVSWLSAEVCAHEGSAVKNVSQEKPNAHAFHTVMWPPTCTEASPVWLYPQETIKHVSKTLFLLLQSRTLTWDMCCLNGGRALTRLKKKNNQKNLKKES